MRQIVSTNCRGGSHGEPAAKRHEPDAKMFRKPAVISVSVASEENNI